MANHHCHEDGFRRGPVCHVCQEIRANSNEVICDVCQLKFKHIDEAAANSRGLRADMVRSGMPVRGMDNAFNHNMRLACSMLRNPTNTGWFAIFGLQTDKQQRAEGR